MFFPNRPKFNIYEAKQQDLNFCDLRNIKKSMN